MAAGRKWEEDQARKRAEADKRDVKSVGIGSITSKAAAIATQLSHTNTEPTNPVSKPLSEAEKSAIAARDKNLFDSIKTELKKIKNDADEKRISQLAPEMQVIDFPVLVRRLRECKDRANHIQDHILQVLVKEGREDSDDICIESISILLRDLRRKYNIGPKIKDLDMQDFDFNPKRQAIDAAALGVVTDIAKKYIELLKKTKEYNATFMLNAKEKHVKLLVLTLSTDHATLLSSNASFTSKVTAAQDIQAQLTNCSENRNPLKDVDTHPTDFHKEANRKKFTEANWNKWKDKSTLNIHKVMRFFTTGLNVNGVTDEQDKDKLTKATSKLPKSK